MVYLGNIKKNFLRGGAKAWRARENKEKMMIERQLMQDFRVLYMWDDSVDFRSGGGTWDVL